MDFGNLGSMLGNMLGGGGAAKEGGAPSGIMGMALNLFGGPEGIKKMIFEQMDNPEAVQMAEEKLTEILDFWAKKYNCTKKEVSFLWQVYEIPAKDEAGNIKIGTDNNPVMIDKFYVIVYVKGETKEKYTVEQLIALIKQNLKDTGPEKVKAEPGTLPSA